MESIVIVLIGLLIAWLILNFTSIGRSNYANTILYPAEFMEQPAQNSALIGAGLASAAKPSVMDATPESSAQPVMMGAMNMSPISVIQPMQAGSGQMPNPPTIPLVQPM